MVPDELLRVDTAAAEGSDEGSVCWEGNGEEGLLDWIWDLVGSC